MQFEGVRIADDGECFKHYNSAVSTGSKRFVQNEPLKLRVVYLIRRCKS